MSENNKPRMMSRSVIGPIKAPKIDNRNMPESSGRSVSNSISADVHGRPNYEGYTRSLSNSTPTENYGRHAYNTPPEFYNRKPEVYSVKPRQDDSEEDDSEQDDSEQDDSEEESEQSDGFEEDDPLMIEARTNRKIEDLELSLKSLLAVNNMLEATVKRQAQEILKLKNQPEEEIDLEKYKLSEDDLKENEEDKLFQRIQKMTSDLIRQGNECIESGQKITSKVISNYSHEDDESEYESQDEDDTQKILPSMRK